MKLFFLIFSIILYYISPNQYSFPICLITLIIFIFLVIRTLKTNYNKTNYMSFFLFFSISFFFVNFFYPTFIYPFEMDYFLVFKRFNFNHNVITKSTVLALIGYCSFLYGLNKKKLKRSSNQVSNRMLNFNLNNYILYFIFFLGLIFNLLLFFLAKDGILNRRSDTFFEISQPLIVLCQVLVNLILILVFYLKKSYFFLVVPILFLFMFLYVGDRGPALQGLMVFLFAYHYFHKYIRIRTLSLLIIIGFVGFTLISSTRSRDGVKHSISEFQIVKYYDLAMDFVVNNRNLYAGYDYANKNGYSYGKSYLSYLFSPVPFLPSFVTNSLYDKEPSELSSGTLLTNEAGATWGLGTNLIADIYMQFGLFGVVFLMLILGYFIRYLENNSFKSLYKIIVCFFVVSFAIYMPRSTLFDSLRYISWALSIYFLIYNILKPYQKLKDEKNISY